MSGNRYAMWRKTALGYPCYLACEVAHPRFMHRDGIFRFRVTVNTGYE